MLFFAEMWERFSYYGMRAILLYFITDTAANGGLGLSANSGQVILASYSAAVYLLAIPGGIFADRVIGPWLSTLYGGLVIMAGHIFLSVPAETFSWLGIAVVASLVGSTSGEFAQAADLALHVKANFRLDTMVDGVLDARLIGDDRSPRDRRRERGARQRGRTL